MPRKPPVHAQFKPGQSGNPQGAKRHDPAKRALKNLTIATYRKVIELVLLGNMDDLKAMALDPATPAIQVGVATAFMKAIKAGDYEIIERIAERIVGKIPDELNVNASTVNANLNTTLDYSKVKDAVAKLKADF